ncbi:hypothetical protein BDN71DRAFT_1447219 [Pleurotus eryngii]|uniref:Uncharacterized protein n=1 Tax=Pleurotus eryngii TaxID=5323 RepID=A0A9P6A0R1_PLEER|nr:hypothetical protein BDN71DRAFT_1447219 [Pleurotus eryngii]
MSEFTVLRVLEDSSNGPSTNTFQVYWSGGNRDQVAEAAVAVSYLWRAMTAECGVVGGSRLQPIKATLARSGHPQMFTHQDSSCGRLPPCSNV